MALGDADLAFFISSGIMLALFSIAYYKLYRKPEVSRTHKVVYAILFPGLVVLGGLAILVFQIFVTWEEVLMFNIVWIPLFLLMLQDLAGHPLMRKFPFGKLLIAVGLTVLLIFCLTFALIGFLWYISVGEWAIPLPIFLVLVVIAGPLFILAARFWGKGEEEFTDGQITSGGLAFLYMMVATFGMGLIALGITPIIYGAGYWMPPHVGYAMMIIGAILLAYSIPKSLKERRKRKMAGY